METDQLLNQVLKLKELRKDKLTRAKKVKNHQRTSRAKSYIGLRQESVDANTYSSYQNSNLRTQKSSQLINRLDSYQPHHHHTQRKALSIQTKTQRNSKDFMNANKIQTKILKILQTQRGDVAKVQNHNCGNKEINLLRSQSITPNMIKRKELQRQSSNSRSFHIQNYSSFKVNHLGEFFKIQPMDNSNRLRISRVGNGYSDKEKLTQSLVNVSEQNILQQHDEPSKNYQLPINIQIAHKKQSSDAGKLLNLSLGASATTKSSEMMAAAQLQNKGKQDPFRNTSYGVPNNQSTRYSSNHRRFQSSRCYGSDLIKTIKSNTLWSEKEQLAHEFKHEREANIEELFYLQVQVEQTKKALLEDIEKSLDRSL